MSGAAAAIITSKLLRTQRELVHRFETAGALSPDRAIPRGDLARLSDSVFSKLSRAGVFVSSGNDHWYLDRAAWDRFQSRQRTRFVVTAAVIVLGVSALFTLWLVLAR